MARVWKRHGGGKKYASGLITRKSLGLLDGKWM